MNIAFSSTPNTDIIYEGNHHQLWSEPCLPAPSSWPPTAFFVSITEALCGLIQQGFNQHISMYFYICNKASIYVIAPPVVFNDVQDVQCPIILLAVLLCSVSAWFLPLSGWWRSHLFPRLSLCLHCVVDEAVKETVSGQVMRWDKGDDSPQSASPGAADKVRMCARACVYVRLYLNPQNYCEEQLGFSHSHIISCPWYLNCCRLDIQTFFVALVLDSQWIFKWFI